jgi:hypothetical protein
MAHKLSSSGFNLLFPELAKVMVNLESHPNASKVQMSLYWKIALFRWVSLLMMSFFDGT